MDWRALVVALIVVLAGCPSANTGSETAATETAGPSTATGSPTATAMPTPTTDAVSESFVVGTGEDRLRYTVTNVTVTDRVGGEFGPTADQQFVVVRLNVTGVAGYVRLTSDAFRLVDARNRTYPTDDSAMLLVDDALALRNVRPGATVEGVVVFDVPADASERRLRIDPANETAGQSQYVALD